MFVWGGGAAPTWSLFLEASPPTWRIHEHLEGYSIIETNWRSHINWHLVVKHRWKMVVQILPTNCGKLVTGRDTPTNPNWFSQRFLNHQHPELIWVIKTDVGTPVPAPCHSKKLLETLEIAGLKRREFHFFVAGHHDMIPVGGWVTKLRKYAQVKLERLPKWG